MYVELWKFLKIKYVKYCIFHYNPLPEFHHSYLYMYHYFIYHAVASIANYNYVFYE